MYEKLYKELVLRYNELEGRTKQLEEENARLKQQIGMANRSDTNIEIAEKTIHSLNKYSSAKEKIQLLKAALR